MSVALLYDRDFDRNRFVDQITTALIGSVDGKFPPGTTIMIDSAVNLMDVFFVLDFLKHKGLSAKQVYFPNDYGPAAIVRQSRILRENIDQFNEEIKTIDLIPVES